MICQLGGLMAWPFWAAPWTKREGSFLEATPNQQRIQKDEMHQEQSDAIKWRMSKKEQ